MAEPFSISNPATIKKRSGMYKMGATGSSGRTPTAPTTPAQRGPARTGSLPPPPPQHFLDGSHSSSIDKAHTNRSCCCGLVPIERGAMVIAVLQLIAFAYEVFVTSATYDKTGDDYAFAFTLALFSFALAIIAVLLLVAGIHRRSAYFLIPHLLIQCSIISTSILLSIYLVLLMVGGTSMNVDAIIAEDSTRGEIGYAQAALLPPIKATFVSTGINNIIASLLVATAIFAGVQLWFFVVVRRCYQLFNREGGLKPSSVSSINNDGGNGRRMNGRGAALPSMPYTPAYAGDLKTDL